MICVEKEPHVGRSNGLNNFQRVRDGVQKRVTRIAFVDRLDGQPDAGRAGHRRQLPQGRDHQLTGLVNGAIEAADIACDNEDRVGLEPSRQLNSLDDILDRPASLRAGFAQKVAGIDQIRHAEGRVGQQLDALLDPVQIELVAPDPDRFDPGGRIITDIVGETPVPGRDFTDG